MNEVPGAEKIRPAEAEGAEAMFVRADMADHGQLRRMLEATLAGFGRLGYAGNTRDIPAIGRTSWIAPGTSGIS